MDKTQSSIEQMLKPYRDFEKKFASPFKGINKKLNAQYSTLQNAANPLKKKLDYLNEPLLNIKQSFENINKIYTSIPLIENPFSEQMDNFKKIGERIKEYAENTPFHILLLAKNGWFIDIDNCELSLPEYLANKIMDGDLDSTDEYLTNYYHDNINSIFETLMHRHSDRKNILSQILNSYYTENFYLLIPTLLTQVDGICFDFTKKKFFIKDNYNRYLPQVTAELEKTADHFLSLYLSPFQNHIPISVSEKYIQQFPCHLNRHEILHGVNTDYGTKINSLKVISLLKYISDTFKSLNYL